MGEGSCHRRGLGINGFKHGTGPCRLLIQVGSMEGFIRRLHKYPVLKKPQANLPKLLAKVKL